MKKKLRMKSLSSLLCMMLIAGDDSEYGLYVKK